MTEKYYNDKGEVGVLYSPDFGAGWYSWNKTRPEILFDKKLIELVLQKDEEDDFISDEAMQYIKDTYGNKKGFYMGGANTLEVGFIPKGTKFIVHEYDGYESIQTEDSFNWITA